MPPELLITSNITLLAQRAIAYARSRIHECSTALDAPIDKLDEMHDKIESMRSSILNPNASLKSLFRVPDIHHHSSTYKIKSSIKQVKATLVGNCDEYARLVLNFLWKQGVDDAELFEIENGDHVFVVIGRKKDSIPSDPTTWGDDAIVCDPWAQAIYPASQIPSKLKCYRDDNGYNEIYAFDSSIHTLKPSFRHDDKQPAQERMQQSFQMTLTKLQLIKNAFVLVTAGLDDSNSAEFLKKTSDLIEQLNHFQDAFLSISLSYRKLEKTLSKYIFQCLECALNIASSLNLQAALHDELIAQWIKHWYDSSLKLNEENAWIVYTLLSLNDSSLALPLIRALDPLFLNFVVSAFKNEEDETILHIFFFRRTKEDMRTLLSRLSDTTISKVADQPLDERTLAEYLLDQYKEMDLFTTLLDRLTQPSLENAMGLFATKPNRLDDLIPELKNMQNLNNKQYCLDYIMTLTKKYPLLALDTTLRHHGYLDESTTKREPSPLSFWQIPPDEQPPPLSCQHAF